MKFTRSLLLLPIYLFCLISLAATTALAQDWRPVDPPDLALKESVVEKNADAEAIFWEVRVTDGTGDGYMLRTMLDHYIRIKIFTERGRESQSKIELPYGFGTVIKDIAARTIKADGSVIELKPEDVYDRTLVKVGGIKVNVKSFALPGVEPGVIIEYRWREIRNAAFYNRMQLQRDIPVQTLKYFIKPFANHNFPYNMRVHTFRGQSAPFVKEPDNFYSMTLTNIPAFHEEPRMPPESEVRRWMLVYYSEDKKLDATAFWKSHGKGVYEYHKPYMKVEDAIRKAATQIIGDASTPEQKLERLFDYCRSRIKNIREDASELTEEQINKAKKNKTPADTLKHGAGTWHDIDMLFAALAAAAGFEVRVASLANRGDAFFDPSFTDAYFMRTEDIAVRVGAEWRFFDPAVVHVPFGMLPWREEGQRALVSDADEPFWVSTPVSGSEKSLEKRTAHLRLSDDGTLEGDVTIEYTGHLAAEKKEINEADSPSERENILTELIKKRLSTAEVSNIHIENITDLTKPFVYNFHVRVSDYAQRTGKRLFLQPAFFQRGLGALFTTNTRVNEVYFHYPWSEEDSVSIELPAGFVLDSPDAPAPLSAGDLSKYDVKIGISKDGRVIAYQRKFFFGNGGTDFNQLRFPVSSYGQLKAYFDQVHVDDNHTITLKQAAATARP